MIFAAANGLGLSLVIPCSQSLIADLYAATFRGRAFGIMQLISAFGVVGGGLFATNIGGTSPFGLDGWRFALHLVAIISILTGSHVNYIEFKTFQVSLSGTMQKILEKPTCFNSRSCMNMKKSKNVCFLLVLSFFHFTL